MQRAAEWAWVPDKDGTPDKPTAKPPAKADGKEGGEPASKGAAAAVEGGGEAGGDGSGKESLAYSAEQLERWKPGQLKELLTGLGLDASGCAEKRDIVEKIMRHPGGAAAAADAAAARGEQIVATVAAPARRRSSGLDGDGAAKPAEEAAAGGGGGGEEEDGFAGLTLADYMGRPTEQAADNGVAGRRPGGAGGGRPGGGGGGGVRGGGRTGRGDRIAGVGDNDGKLDPPSVAGSMNSGRAEISSAASGRGGKVVRLAPAHIAPPSRPAPEWVVDMQVGAPQACYGAGTWWMHPNHALDQAPRASTSTHTYALLIVFNGFLLAYAVLVGTNLKANRTPSAFQTT